MQHCHCTQDEGGQSQEGGKSPQRVGCGQEGLPFVLGGFLHPAVCVSLQQPSCISAGTRAFLLIVHMSPDSRVPMAYYNR